MTQPMPTIRQALARAREQLSSIENFHIEARWLLGKATGLDNSQLILHLDKSIDSVSLEVLDELVARRIAGEPVQYILGSWEFYGLDFIVGEGVLIPRPETELLVDISLKFLKNISCPKILDICCGSGAIPIAIAKNTEVLTISAVELSLSAIEYLQKNLCKHGVEMDILQVDVLNISPDSFATKFDLITANPPYICSDEIQNLDPELHFEPAMALDGGKDGLIFYRAIIPLATRLINHGGALIMEIGCEQSEAVSQLMHEQGFRNISVNRDFSGLDRVVYGEYP